MSSSRREEKGKYQAHTQAQTAESDPATMSGALSDPKLRFKEFLHGVQNRQKGFLRQMINDDEADEAEIGEAISKIEDDSKAYGDETLNAHIQDLKDRQLKSNQIRADKMSAFRKDHRAMFFEIYDEAHDWQESASQQAERDHRRRHTASLSQDSSRAESSRKPARKRTIMERIFGVHERVMEKVAPPPRNPKARGRSAPPLRRHERQPSKRKRPEQFEQSTYQKLLEKYEQDQELRRRKEQGGIPPPPLPDAPFRQRSKRKEPKPSAYKPLLEKYEQDQELKKQEQVKRPLSPLPNAPPSPSNYEVDFSAPSIIPRRHSISHKSVSKKTVAPSVKTAWETIWVDDAASRMPLAAPDHLEIELKRIQDEYDERQARRELHASAREDEEARARSQERGERDRGRRFGPSR